MGDLCYRCAERILAAGARFDFAHFWEDICFKNGPLINPRKFEAKVGPHYKRITDLAHRYGLNIVSLDCGRRSTPLQDRCPHSHLDQERRQHHVPD